MKREQRLKAFTERAIEATEAGALIPPIVYLPRRLRQANLRLTEDNLCLKVDPPTIEENHVRIAAADPVGFLIAMMHGQPIPAFEVGRQGEIIVRYEIADLAARTRIATFLANKNTIRTRNDGTGGMDDRHTDAEYRTMMKNAEMRAALAAENDDG